jgi:spore maturation protein CgeB
MSKINCNLCSSDDYEILFVKSGMQFGINKNYTIVQCKKCGLQYVNPQPTMNDKERIKYDVNYWMPRDPDEIFKKIAVWKTRQIRIESLCGKKGKILDIGCDGGFFLKTMKEDGWSVYGVEVRRDFCRYAKEKLDLDIFSGVLEENIFPDAYFDIVTMWDIIEHLPDPSRTLSIVNRILKDHGLLAISTMNVDSFNAKIFKDKWRFYNPPSHIYFFSLGTLRKMLEKEGFRIVLPRSRFSFRALIQSIYGLTVSDQLSKLKIFQAFNIICYPLSRMIEKLSYADLLEVYSKKCKNHRVY